MILITGATGNIGSNLAFILSKAKVPIKLMVREKKRLAKALLEEDINIVKADYGDTKSLYSAFEGVEKAFLVCSGDPDMTRFEANFIETAKKASISHIVKISITGGGPKALFSTGRWHYESEELLKNSSIPYTILRPHSFMQNFFGYAPFIIKEGAFIAPMGEGKIPMIDGRDVATVAGIALTGEGHEGMTYELTGPEAISFSKAAEVLSTVLETKIKYVDIPMEKARQSIIEGGWPTWMVEDIINLYRFFRDGQAETVSNTLEILLERPGIKFEQFVRDYKLVFNN